MTMQFSVTYVTFWILIKYNEINLSTYQHRQQRVYAWYCTKCFEDIIPFSNISNDEFYETNVAIKKKKKEFKALTRKQN